MSIGPSSKAHKETSITSMKVAVNSMFHSLRKDPAPILFYFGIAFLLVGLPFDVEFPSIYYGIMTLLGAILVSRWYLDQKKKQK